MMPGILITQHRQVDVFCYLMLLLLLSSVLPGCAIPQMFGAQFSERLHEIKSVSIAPPKMQIYKEFAQSEEVPTSEQFSAAEKNFAVTVKQRLEAIGQFTVTDLDLERDPQAAREFKFLTFWEPRDLHFIGRSEPPCVPFLHPGTQERRPLLALREAAQADALLLTYGLSVDKSEEKQREQSRGLGIAFLFPPTAVFTVPFLLLSPAEMLQSAFGSGKSAVQICLIDTKTGDELWSYFSEFNGRDQLSDPEKLKAIVAEALKSFLLAIGELKEN